MSEESKNLFQSFPILVTEERDLMLLLDFNRLEMPQGEQPMTVFKCFPAV